MVLLWLATMMFCERAMGEVYEVGDAAGWTSVGHIDYKAWAAAKSFHSGDTIVFKYNNEFHNVMRVTHKNYNACNTTGAVATYTSGNDSFVIKRQRTHLYFICGFPGHCEAGMKIDIRVHDGSDAPSPLPDNPSPPPSPANVSPPPAPSSPPPEGPPAPAGHKESAAAACSGKVWMALVAVAAYYLASPPVAL
nr:mavicyanin-like [Ipomoea batatas]GMD17181.1 mavicyanin-like [Ipomoea batatas]